MHWRGGPGDPRGGIDPAPGHPAEGGVYLTFQPLLGFHLDLGIGGRGDIGKEKKKQQCDRRKKEKENQSQVQETETRSTDSTGQGAWQSGHPEAQAGDSGPRGGPAGPFSLHLWTRAGF